MLTTTCGCMQGGAVYISRASGNFHQCAFTSNEVPTQSVSGGFLNTDFQ